MKSADDYMRERDQLGAQLSEISNLVAALEIVSWQLAQISRGEDISQLRDAVVGISRALLREVELRD